MVRPEQQAYTARRLTLLLASTALVGIAGALPARAACMGTVCNVTTAMDTTAGAQISLRDAINYANTHPGTAITLQQGLGIVTLGANLPLVSQSTTIDGNGNTLSGAATYRGFLISGVAASGTAAAPTTVSISNLTISNVVAKGGDATAGGGGGLGAGGAVFVGPMANVTLTNVGVTNARAVGGAGAAFGTGFGNAGGGGGLGGNAGAVNTANASASGGGGILTNGGTGNAGVAAGDSGSGGGGGGGLTSAGGNSVSAGNGGTGGSGGLGQSDPNGVNRGGGGGGAGSRGNGGGPGVGGTAGGSGATAGQGQGVGGNGGVGGGGGGGFAGSGGTAGFGGGGGGGSGPSSGGAGDGGFGGGGGASNIAGTGGKGGFGGGGGVGSTYNGGNDISPSQPGASGFGASAATNAGGGGGAAMGGAIFVTAGGTLTISGSGTLAGSLTGGTGTNGTNGSTFGSGIFFEGGTAAAPTTLAFGAGTQTVNGAITDLNGAAGNTTTNNGLAGTGGVMALTKTDAGTLTLTGTNIYTGGTTFGAGVINAGSAGALGTVGALSFTGGTLQYSAASAATDFSGRFSGAANQLYSVDTNGQTVTFASALTSQGGSLTKLGAGTLTSTAANTYTGATAIGAGTLALAGTGSISQSSNVALATGGTFDISRLTNGGTSIVSLGNTAAGQTGTVALGANTLTLTNAAGTFGGTIAGTGGLTLGAGTEVLTGANTYTGATTINGGTLEVDGSIASPNVTVNKGGTLSGTGKIGDPTINAGGTLAPGNAANPTGTLTIVGPLGFAAGSFYNVNITPTANSRTNVTGVTTIAGGTVRVLAGSGTYAPNTRYTILTSTGGVAGTFTQATASTNFAFLTPTLSYDANDVYVTVLPSAPIVTTNPMTGAPTTVPNYRTAAGTQNQLAVASGLTQAGIQSGGTGHVLTALNQLTVPQARAAFDALSGEGLAAAQNIANRSAELFTSSIFDQTTFYGSGNAANSITLTEPIRELADLPTRAAPPVFVQPNRTWRAWATGFGGVDDIHGNGQIGSSYQQNTIYGGTLGVDYQLTPNYLVGVALGGTNGDFLVPGRATSGSTTGGHVAFYDLATFGSFYGASSTSFSYFGNRATRTVSGFGGLGTETERANFDSNEFRSRLEFGRHLAGYGGVLTPFVALELAELRSNGFTENAVQGPGLFRLNVSGQSQASAPAFVGVRLQRATSLGNGITLSPTLQVAYVHEFAPYRSQISTIADLPGSTFLVDGARPARNAAQVKAGAEMAIGANSVIFANFDGEFSGVNQLYAGKGGFRYLW